MCLAVYSGLPPEYSQPSRGHILRGNGHPLFQQLSIANSSSALGIPSPWWNLGSCIFTFVGCLNIGCGTRVGNGHWLSKNPSKLITVSNHFFTTLLYTCNTSFDSLTILGDVCVFKSHVWSQVPFPNLLYFGTYVYPYLHLQHTALHRSQESSWEEELWGQGVSVIDDVLVPVVNLTQPKVPGRKRPQVRNCFLCGLWACLCLEGI